MIKKFCIPGITVLTLIFVACSASAPGTPAVTASQPDQSPTPTSTIALLQPNEEPGDSQLVGGEIEIHIPFDIYTQGELPSSNVPECVNSLPFHLVTEGSRILIEGQGDIDCEFTDQPQDSPISFHVTLDLDGTLNGELLPATIDKPKGWLDAQLLVGGKIFQVYTGFPEEAINPCPESSPCTSETSETFPLPFVKEDGNQISQQWVFILRLKEAP